MVGREGSRALTLVQVGWVVWFVSTEANALEFSDAFDQTVKVAEETPRPEGTLALELGGNQLSGNTDYIVAYANVDAAYRWGWNQTSLDSGGALGRSIVDLDGNGTLSENERNEGYQKTEQELSTDGRYDRFVSDIDSFYGLAGWLHDPFTGYQWRIHGQVGYSRTLFDEIKHSVLAETGFDIARERYTEGVEPPCDTIYAGRGFASWEWQPNEAFQFAESIEAFVNVATPEDVRLVNESAALFRANSLVALKLSHELGYDTVPVDGYARTDHTIAVTLLGSLSTANRDSTAE